MVEVDLLDFVENCKRLAKQALGRHAGEPEVGGLARWQHVVIHCLRIEDEYSYRETENRLECMGDIREILDLDRDDIRLLLGEEFDILQEDIEEFRVAVKDHISEYLI